MKKLDPMYEKMLSYLIKHGFSDIDPKGPKDNAIYAKRKTPIGYEKIIWGIEKGFPGRHKCEMAIGIRIDAIHEAMKPLELRNNNDDIHTFLFNDWAYCSIIGRPEFDPNNGIECFKMNEFLNLKDPVSVDTWFGKYKRFLEEGAFPFFDQVRTVEGYDRFFNGPLEKDPPDFQKTRFDLCNLVAAKLVNNPNYEHLYDIWKQHQEEENMLDWFEDMDVLHEHLAKNFP